MLLEAYGHDFDGTCINLQMKDLVFVTCSCVWIVCEENNELV